MQNKIKIRYCKSSELLKVISLTSKAYAVPYRVGGVVNNYQEILEKVKNDIGRGIKILVAEKNNNLIGAVRFVPINASKLKFGRLAVSSIHRRKGVGAELINSVLEIAREQNYKTVALDVMEEKGLIPFYEKFGFKVKNRKKHQNHHDVFMEKRI